LTAGAITTVGNDILHALIPKNPRHATMRDLPKDFFLESEERQQFLKDYKLFHAEDALRRRAALIADRQRKYPKCFNGERLLVGWNDRNICENENIRGVRASNAHGGSSKITRIDISNDDLVRAHRNGMACFTSSKPFTKKDDLLNFRASIFMDLVFLKGCGVFSNFSKQQPSSEPPRKLGKSKENWDLQRNWGSCW
jgi:hypothetical protein